MPAAPSNMKVSKNGFRHSKERINSCLKQSKTQNQEMAQDDSVCGGASQFINNPIHKHTHTHTHTHTQLAYLTKAMDARNLVVGNKLIKVQKMV